MSGSIGVRYPDFICVGAQKAGTTWLHKKLQYSDEIWLPPLKEIHYFDRVEARKGGKPQSKWDQLDRGRVQRVERAIQWTVKSRLSPEEKAKRISCLEIIGSGKLTDEWYGSIFQASPPWAKCGEVTPEYALLPEAGFQHMLSLNRELKIMYVMRDPIERSWSALRMQEKRTGAAAQVDYTRPIKRKEFIAYSDYASTIDRILKLFARDRVLLLYFDEIVEDSRRLMKRVARFVGVDDTPFSQKNLDSPVHVGRSKELDPSTYAELRAAMRPIYQRLLPLKNPIIENWYKRHYA